MAKDEDREAFRQAMHGVRQLRRAPDRAPGAPPPRPRAHFARAERAAVLADSLADLRAPLAPVIESGEELLYRGPRISQTVLRRLRRGDFRVDAELDLHGLTVPQARAELAAFLAAALEERLRVVRIVHGKGLRSGTRGPVLRAMVNDCLRQIRAVLAFASAREVDGGTGACLVLLESGRDRSRPPARKR
ncbi:MAG: Smr/MutS family protein [Steroidobacteraceae bacterium]